MQHKLGNADMAMQHGHKGPVILTSFSKIAVLHVVLDWQKIYKTFLEKAFFFIFSAFVLKFFKIGSYER